MLDRVSQTITRHRMFAPGQRVGVAVSGGADSVCLLHLLRELAPRWTLCLTVLHLDHCLRGEESRQGIEGNRYGPQPLSLYLRVDVPSRPASSNNNVGTEDVPASRLTIWISVKGCSNKREESSPL
jgi:tRNA(Ile)-lysidine synthase